MIKSTGLSSRTQIDYTYDLDSNRLSKKYGGVTWHYLYDRTDQLVSENTGGTPTAYVYDAYGDMTSKRENDLTATVYAYDLGGRLASITPAGGTAATFKFDALGRHRSRTVGSATDNYAYVGTTGTVYGISTGQSVTDSLVDAAGTRLATKTGSAIGWTLADLHGDFVGDENASRTIKDAFRFDPYGETVCTYTGGSGVKTPWRYQGRLDVSPTADPLYDAGARFYAPSAGVFTQLDTVSGSALNPRSMNRFLYAEGNPTTLIDPTGHCAYGGYGGTCTSLQIIGDTSTCTGHDCSASQGAPISGGNGKGDPEGPLDIPCVDAFGNVYWAIVCSGDAVPDSVSPTFDPETKTWGMSDKALITWNSMLALLGAVADAKNLKIDYLLDQWKELAIKWANKHPNAQANAGYQAFKQLLEPYERELGFKFVPKATGVGLVVTAADSFSKFSKALAAAGFVQQMASAGAQHCKPLAVPDGECAGGLVLALGNVVISTAAGFKAAGGCFAGLALVPVANEASLVVCPIFGAGVSVATGLGLDWAENQVASYMTPDSTQAVAPRKSDQDCYPIYPTQDTWAFCD